MVTDGDVIFIIENLISKGLLKEYKNKEGKIVYNAKGMEGLFIRCMDCHILFDNLDESIEHSIKLGHQTPMNVYERAKVMRIIKEIQDAGFTPTKYSRGSRG